MAVVLRGGIPVCCEEYSPSLLSFTHQVNKRLKTSFEQRTASKYNVNLGIDCPKNFSILKDLDIFGI